MDLYIDNKPAHVYVPKSNVKQTYETLQSRLSKEGSIPIGIDHLQDNTLKSNPILQKLDLLNVGEITEIQYTDDTIQIVEAQLTNPLIKKLYDDGELDMVSIVANSTTSECPQDYDYIINTTDITRVDIVEKGACPTCNIPKPTDSDDAVVYARYSIQKEEKEEPIMAEEVTLEAIEKLIADAIEPINKRLTALEEENEGNSSRKAETNKENNEETEEVKAMKAEIDKLQKETATAKVDSLIAAGKILPAQKEASIELCAKDSAHFEELYKDAPTLIDLNTKQSLLAGAGDGDDDDDDPTPEAQNLNNVLSHFSGDE